MREKMGILNLTRQEQAANLDSGNMFNTGSEMFKWPVITQEMTDNVVQVLNEAGMSGTDITKKFERAFADWHKVEYGLGHSSGTAALHCAMYGVGIGPGDEVICPSVTYWASCVQAMNLGASVVFADIEPDTLCIDPDDIEHRITPRTKAIIVVHYLGYPADMDRIMPIARKHGLKVIEDVSHAHGSLYKGRMTGTFGDAAGYSMMSAKSFAIGEAGILLTNEREVYERAVAFAHHDRQGELSIFELKRNAGLSLGGFKYRMHQMSSAVGLEMVKIFPGLMKEVDRAMNYFWDQLEGVPGIRAHRPSADSGSTMGAWYCPHGLYNGDELGGLSLNTFCRALQAEGINGIAQGCNMALHTHRLFSEADVYGDGRPTNLSGPGANFPVSESIQERTFYIPWFKQYRPEEIDRYVEIFRKVADNCGELLPIDESSNEGKGLWALSSKKH